MTRPAGAMMVDLRAVTRLRPENGNETPGLMNWRKLHAAEPSFLDVFEHV